MQNSPLHASRLSSPGRFSSVRSLATLALIAAVCTAPVAALAQVPTFNTLATTAKGGEPWFRPGSAAVGDYNGDGKLDAIITDGSYNSDVRLLLGNGNGTFTPGNINVSASPTNPTPGMIKADDFNGDGRLDAVFVSPQGNLAPTVLLNTGNNGSGVPQFTATTYTPVYSGLRSVTVGDLNGDNRADFIVGNAYGSLQIYLNNGNGTFTAGTSTTLQPNVGGSTGPGVIADLNGDGKADYLVSSNQTGATNIFFGNGDGTLNAPAVYPGYGLHSAVGDLNGDGKPDFAQVDGANLIVYRNNGNGTFAGPFTMAMGLGSGSSLALTDMTGDGKLDAIVTDFGSIGANGLAIFVGNGDGTFGSANFYNVNRRPLDVAARDFNGDGKLDLATVGYESNDYGVLLNTTTYVQPLPTQTLTILGGAGNIGDVAANVEYFNPATGNWQPAYLVNYAPYGHPSTHPWGNVPGTDHWINYKVDGGSDAGAGPTVNQTLWYQYRVRFTVPADAINAQMTFSIKADNFAQIAINGVTAGGSTVFINGANVNNVVSGTADQVNVDAAFSQAVQPGENTIMINIGDFGGLNGFNFRIDLSMQASQPIEVVPVDPDTTAPVISAPADITAEATSSAGATVTFTATAVDDVDGPVSVLADPASGSTFALGSTVVDLGASDAAGNIATASFNVTVRDTIAPVLTVPASVTAEATSAAGASVSYGAATATDAVGVTGISYTKASGSTFALGSTSVGVTASDAAGNSSSGSFSVTVQDTTAPALSVPANITAEATSAAGAAVTYAPATATDAVGVASITYSTASGSTFALGTTSVAVNAADAAGNASSGSFTVTVQDTTAPTITTVAPSTREIWPPNKKMVPVTVSVGANDAVGIASSKIVSVTTNQPDGKTQWQITGPLSVNLLADRLGNAQARIYTILIEVRDGAGNVTTQSTAVTVPHDQRR